MNVCRFSVSRCLFVRLFFCVIFLSFILSLNLRFFFVVFLLLFFWDMKRFVVVAVCRRHRVVVFFVFSFLCSISSLMNSLSHRNVLDYIDIEMADLLFLFLHLSRIHFSFFSFLFHSKFLSHLFSFTLSRSLFCRRLPFRNYNLFLYGIYLHFIIVIMNYERRCGVPYYWHIADIQFDWKTK